MQMSDDIQIAAPRQRVYDALNDPDVLKACIPGCEKLEKTSDTEMAATVMAKVGPVRARFNGEVTLSDLNPPEGYTISGEGKGGAAGFAKGSATVKLTESDGGTSLHYDVKADVGGKLAQLGSRLIDGAARSYARDFFSEFKKQVEGPGEETAEEAGAEPVVGSRPEPLRRSNITWWVMLGAVALAVVVAAMVMG